MTEKPRLVQVTEPELTELYESQGEIDVPWLYGRGFDHTVWADPDELRLWRQGRSQSKSPAEQP